MPERPEPLAKRKQRRRVWSRPGYDDENDDDDDDEDDDDDDYDYDYDYTANAFIFTHHF